MNWLNESDYETINIIEKCKENFIYKLRSL